MSWSDEKAHEAAMVRDIGEQTQKGLREGKLALACNRVIMPIDEFKEAVQAFEPEGLVLKDVSNPNPVRATMATPDGKNILEYCKPAPKL